MAIIARSLPSPGLHGCGAKTARLISRGWRPLLWLGAHHPPFLRFVSRYHFSSFLSSVWILAPGCERVCSDVQSQVSWLRISTLLQCGCHAQQTSAAPSSIADTVGFDRSSNKPTEELYRNFKANFPELSRPVIGSTAPAHGTHTLADALDIPLNPRYAAFAPPGRTRAMDDCERQRLRQHD